MEPVATEVRSSATEASRDDLRLRVRSTLARLSATGALPTLPAAASAALALARDPDADVDDLSRVIQTDAGLAARVLRVANSAALGRRSPARRVQEAIITVGLRKTCDVLVAACAKRLYEASSPNAERLWNHALAAGVAAEVLARETGTVDVSSAFLPGLFHDVGRVAFLLADPAAAEVIEDVVARGYGDTPFLEREWYGFDHAQAGAILVEDWGLALELCDAIRWHHDPSSAGAAQELAYVLNAADDLAYRVGCGSVAERPPSITTAHWGFADDDEAAITARVQSAWEEQRALLA
jgi:HD-like signal output (HDOD) protein